MNEEGLEHMGAAVIVVDPATKKILLGERMNAYKAGYFGLPGGRSELNETLESCARREVEEETGLKVKDVQYIGVVRELQDGYNFVHFGMTTSSYSGELGNPEPEKCEGWEWHSIESLPENILPGHKAIIDMYLDPSKKLVELGH